MNKVAPVRRVELLAGSRSGRVFAAVGACAFGCGDPLGGGSAPEELEVAIIDVAACRGSCARPEGEEASKAGHARGTAIESNVPQVLGGTHRLRIRIGRKSHGAGPLWVTLAADPGQLRAPTGTDETSPEPHDARELGSERLGGWVPADGERVFDAELVRPWGAVRVWADGTLTEPPADVVEGAEPELQAFGISDAEEFPLPGLAEVQGFGRESPYAGEYVEVASYPGHELVVTAVTREGFYVTDADETRGYGAIYAHAPPSEELWPGRRLSWLGGSVEEFYGLTELGFAVFSLVPLQGERTESILPATTLEAEWSDPAALERFESARVGVKAARVADWVGPELATEGRFGPGRSSCDFNGDERIDWSGSATGADAERRCAEACARDERCSEWTEYRRFRTFKVSTPGGALLAIDASAVLGVDAERLAGRTLERVFGNLREFAPASPAFRIALRDAGDLGEPNIAVSPEAALLETEGPP